MTDTERPNLLIISHAPSPNTRRLRQALTEGAASMDGVTARVLSPFDTQPEDVIAASAYILSTPENLGYMSGALKDFFDRCYYPCLDRTQGRTYLLLQLVDEDVADSHGERELNQPGQHKNATRVKPPKQPATEKATHPIVGVAFCSHRGDLRVALHEGLHLHELVLALRNPVHTSR